MTKTPFDDGAGRQALIDALLGRTSKPQGSTDPFGDIPTVKPATPLGGLFGLGIASKPPLPPVGIGIGSYRSAENSLLRARKVFFSFHYVDIMRVNNVRKAMEFQKGSVEGEISLKFYDRSLWETSKRSNPEALKRLIREGMNNSSVLCVLIGTHTWSRPWVRYEIARSVIDGKGVLAVDINSINHHQDKLPHPRGLNPLDFMAIGSMSDGTFRLFERIGPNWVRFAQYDRPVQLPKYLKAPPVGYVRALSAGSQRYDFAIQNGSRNLGGWISLAAALAGRS